MVIPYPDSAIVYKAAEWPLISLSGECLLKNFKYIARSCNRNISPAPIGRTSKLAIEKINSEGTDE
jgi:hypothetical protein